MSNNIFYKDIHEHGSYLYNSNKLSCMLANQRINKGIQDIVDCRNKSFFDIGCGDGSTAFALYHMGAKSIFGIDPIESAVKTARKLFEISCKNTVNFQVGDVYSYITNVRYDIVTFSRVLHHMSDPEKAISNACQWGNNILIIEPNGNNPIVKLIEKLSTYHITHNEKSFRFSTIANWLHNANYEIVTYSYINLVPMFCPNWIAKLCKFLEPLIERIPIIRNICCGQIIIYAKKKPF